MTCPHDDVDVMYDDMANEPIQVLCLQCHEVWHVVKVEPVRIGLELLKEEPVPEYQNAGAIMNAMSAELARAQTAVTFLASVIKAGEPWSDDCERAVRSALDVSGDTGDE